MTSLIIANPRLPQARVNTATATLVDLGAGPLALTCLHVIEKFQNRKKEDPQVRFQLGDLPFDPLPRLRPVCRERDLVAIDLAGLPSKKIANESRIGGFFLKPGSWPCKPISQGNWVTASGFPAELKTTIGLREYSFGTFSVGAATVCSVHDSHFVIQVDREYWEMPYMYDGRTFDEFREFEGMSGGPVFIERRTGVGVHYFELVGIIYEYQPVLDILYAVPAHIVQADGTISI